MPNYVFADMKQWPNAVGNLVLIVTFLLLQASSLVIGRKVVKKFSEDSENVTLH